jgi:hypothetical protein
MARISLGAYSLRVKDSSGEFVNVDEVTSELDLLEILKEYLKNLKKQFSHDSREKKLLRVLQLTARNRILNGLIETGEYGFESNLYDLGRKAVSHKRNIQEAEMLPFYFLVEIPKDSDHGIILLQRFKQYGMRRILMESLRAHFSVNYPDLKIYVAPLIPGSMVKRYLTEGRITKVRFVSHTITSDIADAYDSGTGRQEGGQLELVLRAKRDGWLPLRGRLRAFLDKKRKLSNFVELEDFKYDDVKIEVELNRNRRTVDLSNLQKIRAYIDVSDQIKIMPNGHPSFESIDYVAKELLNDLKETQT